MNIMAIVIYPLSYNSVQNQKNVFPFKNMQEQASRQKRQGKEPYRTKRARIREETGTLYIYVYICVCVHTCGYIYIYPYIQVWQKDKRFYQTAASPFTLHGESNLLVRAIDGQVFLTFQTYKMHPSSFKRDKD